jgi:hypothetical protein
MDIPHIVSAMPVVGSFKTKEIEKELINLVAKCYLLIT